MKPCEIWNESTQTLVIPSAQIADNLWARFWGLLGRRRIGVDEGLLIEPCSSVHTLFMRFTIDVVFLDRDRRVLKVATVRPFRAALARGSKSVLELAEGSAARHGIEVGHSLTVDRTRTALTDDLG